MSFAPFTAGAIALPGKPQLTDSDRCAALLNTFLAASQQFPR
jgi:hypothetical protein